MLRGQDTRSTSHMKQLATCCSLVRPTFAGRGTPGRILRKHGLGLQLDVEREAAYICVGSRGEGRRRLVLWTSPADSQPNSSSPTHPAQLILSHPVFRSSFVTDNQGPSDRPEDQHLPQTPKQHVSARVPEGVGQGVFSTGSILITGGSEFVIDFIQNLGPPATVVARVVIPHNQMGQFIAALQKNIEMYTERFGAPPTLPKPDPPPRPQTVQEVYDELKLPDENLTGAYANGLMIGHSASEFKLDFLSNLFPHSAVACRVFLAAPQAVRLLDSMKQNYSQFQQRVKEQQEQQRRREEDGDDSGPPLET